MLGLGLDAGLLIRSLRWIRWPRSDQHRTIRTSFTADYGKPPLRRPPEAMRPDRPEVMTGRRLGQKEPRSSRGVNFECLVGSHNGGRNLTTGFVTFEPAAKLAMHTHPFTEAITLVHGQAMVEVEGRRYQLGRLDTVVIPPGRAHSAAEPFGAEIDSAATSPWRPIRRRRNLVHESYPPRQMLAMAEAGARAGTGDSVPEAAAIRGGPEHGVHRLLQRVTSCPASR